jgi:serine/threonine-protein kinase
MPDFQRKTLTEVQAWASGAGMAVAVNKDFSSLFPAGTILNQTPDPDAVLAAESKISFVVSARPNSGSPGAGPGTKMFHYEISQGGAETLVRIVVVDKYGERELFNGLRKPGSKIDLPLQETGSARVKIYLNGTLVEERDL